MSNQRPVTYIIRPRRRGPSCLPWISGFLLLAAFAVIWPGMAANISGRVPTSATPRPTIQSRSIKYKIPRLENPAETQAGTVVQTLHSSNLRSGPGLEFAIVEVVPAGYSVVPIGQSTSREWLRLARGTWIWHELLDPIPTPLPVLESDPTGPKSIVIKATTDLWAGPSQYHDQLGAVQPERLLTVLGRNREGTWLAVRMAGTNHNQWAQAADVAYPFIDLLPVVVSDAVPDTEAVFDFLAEHAAKQTDSTRAVRVAVQRCGRANAFAVTRNGRKYVIMCQEMLTRMWLDFAEIEAFFPSPLEYTVAAASGILAVALHEYGHLLMKDPVAARGIDNLGKSVAKAQDIALRYGTTFGEDMADLYSTVVLIELSHELAEHPETRIALPTDYVALGPVMMGYVLAKRHQGREGWSEHASHSPPYERLATGICAGLDGRGQSFAMLLDNLSGFQEQLHDLSAKRGQTCLESSRPEPESYAALVREIEDLFALSLPAWW